METILLDSSIRDELNMLMEQFGYDSLDLLLLDMAQFINNHTDEFTAEFGVGAVMAEEAL
jgi:hypothetical protein